MINQRDEVIKLAKEFTDICHKKDIWYAVINSTLLSTIRSKKMLPWTDRFDVIMTPESFNKLKKLFKNRVLENFTDDRYPFLYAKFLKDKNIFIETSVCLNVFLILPSTEERVAKFVSNKTRKRYKYNLLLSKWEPTRFKDKVSKARIKMFGTKNTPITYKETAVILHEKRKFTGYFIMNSPFENPSDNWIQTFTTARTGKKFEGFTVFVPRVWKNILIERYGRDYKTPKRHHIQLEYKDVINRGPTEIETTITQNKNK